MQILLNILLDLAVTSKCVLRRSKFQKRITGYSCSSRVYLYRRTKKITLVEELNLFSGYKIGYVFNRLPAGHLKKCIVKTETYKYGNLLGESKALHFAI